MCLIVIEMKSVILLKQIFLGVAKNKCIVEPAISAQNKKLKQIWNNENYKDYGVERIIRLLCMLSSYLFPTLYLRDIAGRLGGWYGRKLCLDVYTILNLVFPLLILGCGWYDSSIIVFICTYLSIATISYLINLVTLAPEFSQPSSYLRSIICLGINFIQIVACFAVLYLFLGVESFRVPEDVNFDAIRAFYFSLVTATTIGYGDITPLSNMAVGLTITQICISLIFFYVVLAKFVSHIEERTYANSATTNQSSSNRHKSR